MDLVLYSAIQDYIYSRVNYFAEEVLLSNLTLALTVALALMTLWVMVQGYLIVTGRSQEGLKGFVYNLGKSYFIIAIALGVAGSGEFAVQTLTKNLSDGISQIMTGDSDRGSDCLMGSGSIIGCKIDLNLKATQTMISSLTVIDTADDDYLEEKLTQAKWFAGVGTAGPAIVAGTMLIMFRIAMALFIGFAPIFILCLLFKKTAPLFQKWLYYGLATIFSGVMLGVMAEIAMDLTATITVSSGAVGAISSILTGKSVSGIMQTVTQQLGLGLILSTLLITVPPMAGFWFNGVMGSYSPYSVFDRSGIVPPNIDGGRSYQQQVESRVSEARQGMVNNREIHHDVNHGYSVHRSGSTNAGNTINSFSDSVKSQSQIHPVNEVPSHITDKLKQRKGEKS